MRWVNLEKTCLGKEGYAIIAGSIRDMKKVRAGG